jgi:hypothetical protein
MHCHVSYNPEPNLPDEMGSDAATHFAAPNLTSLPKTALTLPHTL